MKEGDMTASEKKSKRPSPSEVRRLRKALGLTQAQAAQLVHATMRSWQNWESEKSGPNMSEQTWELFRLKTRSG